MTKICLAGLGYMGKTHLDRYKMLMREGEDIELAGIFTRHKHIAEDAETSARHYNDFEEMLLAEKPDAVDITLPDNLHRSFTERALALGVNVLCEKPIALTEADGRAMLDAAERAGKILMVAHCCRYMTEYIILREIVESNRLGRPRMASFHRLSGRPSWAVDNWLMNTAMSGGCVVDMHIHDIDIVNWLFGKPLELSALGLGTVGVSAQYRYENMFATLQSNWDVAGNDYPFTSGFEVDFENGTVRHENGVTAIYVQGKSVTKIPSDTVRDGYYGEIKHFVRALEGKENVGNETAQAAEAVGLARKEMESINNLGAWVTARDDARDDARQRSR